MTVKVKKDSDFWQHLKEVSDTNKLIQSVDSDKLFNKVMRATKFWPKNERKYLEEAIRGLHQRIQRDKAWMAERNLEHTHQQYERDDYGSWQTVLKRCAKKECECQRRNNYY